MHQAAILFREKGYGAASMRELAERVGIEAASLYNHISSKEAILKEICFDTANDYVRQLDKINETYNSPHDKVKELIINHVRMIVKDVASVAVCNNEWKHLNEPFLSDFAEIRRHYERRFAEIIQEGIDKKQFGVINASVALFTILAAVRWVEHWYKPGRGISAKELEADICSMLLNGLIIRS